MPQFPDDNGGDGTVSELKRDVITADEYSIVPSIPPEFKQHERWFVWKYDQGRKIPRAPWNNIDNPETFVSAMEPENWVSFSQAREFIKYEACGADWGLATCIPNFEKDEFHKERIVFIDCDDVRDDETGEIHPQAWHLLRSWTAPIYISTSGTGLHGFVKSSVPQGKKLSATIELRKWEHTDSPEIEFYAGNRFIAMTGRKIVESDSRMPVVHDKVHDIFNTHANDWVDNEQDDDHPGPNVEYDGESETTNSLQELYDAVAKVKPRDIRIKSKVTNSRGDCKDLNPSWEKSDSGTRVAQFEDGFLYRKGMTGLSCLQMVALEERIITSVGEYPKGDKYEKAVDALRKRGAKIPEYEPPEKKSTFDELQ